jgi:hypothetical protein
LNVLLADEISAGLAPSVGVDCLRFVGRRRPQDARDRLALLRDVLDERGIRHELIPFDAERRLRRGAARRLGIRLRAGDERLGIRGRFGHLPVGELAELLDGFAGILVEQRDRIALACRQDEQPRLHAVGAVVGFERLVCLRVGRGRRRGISGLGARCASSSLDSTAITSRLLSAPWSR